MSKILRYRNPQGPPYSVNESQHLAALSGKNDDIGHALRKMLKGWEAYAAAHEERYESKIGDDYALGPWWAAAGLAIKRLLDGDCGGWDCGSLSANILEAIDEQGIPHDGYSVTLDDE